MQNLRFIYYYYFYYYLFIIVNIIIAIVIIFTIIIIIIIRLIKCLLREKILLFIFNPCINLQLICPCANFYFILIHLFVFFTCNKSSIVFILSLDPFLVDLLALYPLEMLEGFCFSVVSRGCEIRVLVIYRSINDDLIWLVVFPVYTLWGCRRACGFQVFSGDMESERWPEVGRAKETNIYQQ